VIVFRCPIIHLSRKIEALPDRQGFCFSRNNPLMVNPVNRCPQQSRWQTWYAAIRSWRPLLLCWTVLSVKNTLADWSKKFTFIPVRTRWRCQSY